MQSLFGEDRAAPAAELPQGAAAGTHLPGQPSVGADGSLKIAEFGLHPASEARVPAQVLHPLSPFNTEAELVVTSPWPANLAADEALPCEDLQLAGRKPQQPQRGRRRVAGGRMAGWRFRTALDEGSTMGLGHRCSSR
jgi:hypothetical protein